MAVYSLSRATTGQLRAKASVITAPGNRTSGNRVVASLTLRAMASATVTNRSLQAAHPRSAHSGDLWCPYAPPSWNSLAIPSALRSPRYPATPFVVRSVVGLGDAVIVRAALNHVTGSALLNLRPTGIQHWSAAWSLAAIAANSRLC